MMGTDGEIYRCRSLADEFSVDVDFRDGILGREANVSGRADRTFTRAEYCDGSRANGPVMTGRIDRRARVVNGIKLDIEPARLQQEVGAMLPSIESDPLERALRQGDLLGDVAVERDFYGHGMIEARTENRVGFVKIAAGIIDFVWRSSCGAPVDFDGGARRRAGDGQAFGVGSRSGPEAGGQREQCAETGSPRRPHRTLPGS